MNLKNTILGIGFAGLTLLGIGCLEKSDYPKNSETTEKSVESIGYFAEVPMSRGTHMVMTKGDFDGDGDLDLIVGTKTHGKGGGLYFFENDGKGNFKLRPSNNY